MMGVARKFADLTVLFLMLAFMVEFTEGICKVDEIQLQQDFNLNRFAGRWYDIARTEIKHETISLDSSVGQLEVNAAGRMHLKYTGKINGECAESMTALGYQNEGAKLWLVFYKHTHGHLHGHFWVVDTDYDTYALVYGCFKEKMDGACHEHHQLVYIMGRESELSSEIMDRLLATAQQTLCVAPQLVHSITQGESCPMVPSPGDRVGAAHMAVQASAHGSESEMVPVKLLPMSDAGDGSTWAKCIIEKSSGQPSQEIEGSVYFEQMSDGRVSVWINLSGFDTTDGQGKHGFHIHEKGALGSQCKETGGHFNPESVLHGGPQDALRHVGDLGNIQEDAEGNVHTLVVDSIIKLSGDNNILGRAVVVHAATDDLGRGAFADSKTTGHAGARLGCCLIESCAKPSEGPWAEKRAECKIEPTSGIPLEEVEGLVKFWQPAGFAQVFTEVELNGFNFTDDLTSHGFHVHVNGELGNECKDAGGHFNPENVVHGGIDDDIRHVGDLGNVVEDDEGNVKTSFYDRKLKLGGPHSIMGKSVVVHELLDDFNTGGFPDSNTTGHAGARLGCCTITEVVRVNPKPDVSKVIEPAPPSVINEVPVKPVVKPEYNRCLFRNIRPHPGLQTDQILGKWNGLYKYASGGSSSSSNRAVWQWSSTPGVIDTFGTHSVGGRCVNTLRGTLTEDRVLPGLLYMDYGIIKGPLKIVYVSRDNNYMIAYLCDGQMADGSCRKSVIAVMGRTKIEIPANIWWQEIKPQVSKLCYDVADIRRINHAVECPLQLRNTNRVCPFSGIDTHDDFQLKHWIGHWYLLATHNSDNAAVVLSGSTVLLPKLDGTGMNTYFTGSMRNRTCLPTYKGSVGPVEVDPSDDPAYLSADYGSGKAPLKIAYMTPDKNYVLGYYCKGMKNDGSCTSVTVDILGRSKDLPFDARALLLNKVNDFCLDITDFEMVPQYVECKVNVRPENCTVSNFPLEQNVNWTRLSGLWYDVVRLGESNKVDSPVWYQSVEKKKEVLVAFRGQKSGQCSTAMGSSIQITSEDGDIVIESSRGSRPARVMYTDYDNAVVWYTCKELEEDGSCLEGQAEVHVMQRSKGISPQLMDWVSPMLESVCLDPSEVDMPHHDVNCDLTEKDIRWCRVKDFEVQEDFDPEWMLGKWYAMVKLAGTVQADSSIYRISKTSSWDWEIIYTGSRDGKCLPNAKATFTSASSDDVATFTIMQGHHEGILKVLYGDPRYMVLYECYEELESGLCAEGQGYVEILSREPFLEKDLIHVAEGACQERSDFRLVWQDIECPFETPAELPVHCTLADIPMAESADLTSITGKWYSMATAQESPGWDSNIIDIALLGDQKSLKISGTGALNGTCQLTTNSYYIPMGKTGKDFRLTLGPFTGFSRIVLYDGQLLVLYECMKLENDGAMCADGYDHVGVYSRSSTQLSKYQVGVVSATLFDMCLTLKQFAPVKHTVSCDIEREAELSCRPSQLLLQRDVKISMLTGTWYLVARNRGSALLRYSSVRVVLEGDTYYMHEAPTWRGVCLPRMKIEVKPQRNTAVWIATLGESSGQYKILFADNQYKLVHECLSMNGVGDCKPGFSRILLLSRSKEVTEEALRLVIARTGSSCLARQAMELSPNREDCSTDIFDRAGCPLETTPSPDHSDTTWLERTWYVAYTLRGNDKSLDSGAMRYKVKNNGNLELFYTGAVDEGECIPTTMAIWKRYTPMPWTWKNPFGLKSKVIYIDSHFAVMYRCLDNGCSRRKLSVLSRVRGLPADTIDRMSTVLRQSCVEPGDFDLMSREAGCELSSCKVEDLPVVDNLQFNKYSGIWYSNAILDSPGTFLSFDAETTLVITQQDDSLMTVLSPIIKGVCSPSTTIMLRPKGRKTRGDFIFNHRGNLGYKKILYNDYNYAVIAQCFKVVEAGECASGYSNIILASRVKGEASEAGTNALKEIATKVCQPNAELKRTVHSVPCELSYSGRRSCRLDDVLVLENYIPSLLYGTWNLLARQRHIQSEILASTFIFSGGSNNTINYGAAARHSDGKCHNAIGNMWPVAGQPATFVYELNGVPGLTKVLSINAQYMVTYDCEGNDVDEDGMCPPEKEQVEIWGHGQMVDRTNKERLLENTKAKTCAPIGSMINVPPNNCEVPQSCNSEEFMEADDYHLQDLLGSWYMLGRTTSYETNQHTAAAKFVRVPRTQGRMRFTVTGKKRNARCYTNAGEAALMSGDATYRIMTNNLISYKKILYVDDLHLITHDCFGGLRRGACPMKSVEVSIWSRSTQPLAKNVWSRMMKIAKERTLGCVLGLIRVPYAEGCPLPSMIGDTCAIDQMVTAPSLRSEQLMGRWYELVRSNTVPEITWDAAIFNVSPGKQGNTVITDFTARLSATNPQCIPDVGVVYQKTNNPAIITRVFEGQDTPTRNIVVYADYQYSVWFTCLYNEMTSSGACRRNRTRVSVLSRSPEPMSQDDKTRLGTVLDATLCLSIGDYVTVNHTYQDSCEFPTIAPVAPPVLPSKSCRVADYPTQPDFNHLKFAGVWYEMGSTRYSAMVPWQSGLVSFKPGAGGSLDLTYTGTRGNVCQGPLKGHLVPGDGSTAASADMNLHLGPRQMMGSPWSMKFSYKVLATDYDTTAVVHSCYLQGADGVCVRSAELLQVFSRSKQRDDDMRGTVHKFVNDKLCIDPADVVQSAMEADCWSFIKSRPSLPQPIIKPPGEGASECSPMACMMFCEEYVKDANGCNTCQCAEAGGWGGPTNQHCFRDEEGAPPCGTSLGGPMKNSTCCCTMGASWTSDRGQCELCPQSGTVEYQRLCGSDSGFDISGTYKRDINECKEFKGLCENGRCLNTIGSFICTCDSGFRSEDNKCIDVDECAAEDTECGEPDTCVNTAGSYDCVCSSGRMPRLGGTRCMDMPCAVPMCKNRCEFGYWHTPRGCMTCICNEAPTTTTERVCPNNYCFMRCRYGFQRDENDCEICACKEPICPLSTCLFYCEHGFKKDDKGCDTCECEEPLCSPVMCHMFCPRGFKKDENDCDLCECVEEPQCPDRFCMLFCRNGYVQDENGCDLCECKSLSDGVQNDAPYAVNYKARSNAVGERVDEMSDDIGADMEENLYDDGMIAKVEKTIGRFWKNLF